MVRHLNGRPVLLSIAAFLVILTAVWLDIAEAADLTLTWTDNAGNESGFEIQRKTGTGGTFAQQAFVGANVTTYVDTALPAATTFCYRIRAYNSAGNSAFTPDGCKATPSGTTTFNFSLAQGGNKSVTRGQSVSNVISATLLSGSSQPVTFSASGLPTGVTASFATSNSCTPTCTRTLNLVTASSTVAGTYPITVTGSGGGIARSTSFDLSVTTPESPSTVYLEAESGALTAPMVVRSDSSASNSKFVEVPAGIGDNFNDETKGGPGEVKFAITIPQAGTRALWARTKAPDSSSDSFYITKNGALVKEWLVPQSTIWQWRKVADLTLASGTVNLAFRQREDGTKLDRILLTSDLSLVPGTSTPTLATVAFSESHDLSISVVKKLTADGSGNGSVSSIPAGLACGSDCSAAYSPGTLVRLTATPATGSVFAGWSGHADCADGTVTMKSDIGCSATFSPQGLGLNVVKSGNGSGTVTSSPTGIACGSDCAQSFADGTPVKLTATAASGSVFKGWKGGGCGGENNCTVVVSGSTSVTAIFDAAPGESAKSKIGVYRPSTGEFFLDQNGNGLWDGCSVDICLKWLKQKSGVPVAGIWDGGETSRIGTFDAVTGAWYLDRNGNGRWDGCAVDECITSFGSPGDFPVVRYPKDSTTPAIGIFHSELVAKNNKIADNGLWRFDANGNEKFDGCRVDRCIGKFGRPGDFAVVGDWDGSGFSKIGLFTREGNQWQLDYNGNGVWDGCEVDRCPSNFGQLHDLPVVGDWDGTGHAKIGVFRPSTGNWLLDNNGNGLFDNCAVDICVNSFGMAGDRPVTGNW